MAYRNTWSDALVGEDVDQFTFRFVFVLGPLLVASFLPSLVFGVLLNQWGSNLIWGSVFGLGWCIAAFAAGGLTTKIAWLGLAWGWAVLFPLYLFATWLWRALPSAKRKIALRLLLASFFVIVPAEAMMSMEAAGIHFPDYSLHMATSY